MNNCAICSKPIAKEDIPEKVFMADFEGPDKKLYNVIVHEDCLLNEPE